MKVKTLSRRTSDHTRSSSGDLHPVQRNVDPKLHPLEAPREYQRALNAVKMERMFAKPFVGSLEGHMDGVYCLAKHPRRLNRIISGSCDGEVRIWSLSTQKSVYNAILHKGFVNGICITPLGDHFISVGQDKTIRMARMDQVADEAEDGEEREEPLAIPGKTFFTGVDHHRRRDVFATSGPGLVELWTSTRSEPTHTFNWGTDTVNCVKFNPVEVDVFASCADDRTVTLYDVRTESPVRKITMAMRSNAVCWNPMEAFNFTVANEDHNLYTFDMRKMDSARNVHKDHVSAVLDIDYAPTGKQFVSGAYDKSIRIFDVDRGHSGEIYHTKRMQRIFAVLWSADNKFVMSASDEASIRLWKATAWEKLGPKSAREGAALKYADKLKDKFKHHPEIKRIARGRNVPKPIHKAAQEKREMERSRKRRESNKRKHSAPGAVPHKKERRRQIVAEHE